MSSVINERAASNADAPSGTPRTPAWVTWRMRLLYLAVAMAPLLVAAIPIRSLARAEVVVAITSLSAVSLLSFWTTFAGRSVLPRLPELISGVLLIAAWMAWRHLRAQGGAFLTELQFDLLVIGGIAGLTLLSFLFWRRTGVSVVRLETPSPRAAAMQFSIGQIIAWTTIACLYAWFASVVRTTLPLALDDLTPQLLLIGTYIALATVLAAWAALTLGRPWLKLLASGTLATLLAAFAVFVGELRDLTYWARGLERTALFAMIWLIVVGAFSVVRSCGYRLVRSTNRLTHS